MEALAGWSGQKPIAGLTLSFWRDVHAMFDLHVPAEVPLQVKLTGAVRTLEGLVAGMEMHVAQKVVHSVKGLATHLERKKKKKGRNTLMNTDVV